MKVSHQAWAHIQLTDIKVMCKKMYGEQRNCKLPVDFWAVKIPKRQHSTLTKTQNLIMSNRALIVLQYAEANKDILSWVRVSRMLLIRNLLITKTVDSEQGHSLRPDKRLWDYQWIWISNKVISRNASERHAVILGIWDQKQKENSDRYWCEVPIQDASNISKNFFKSIT